MPTFVAPTTYAASTGKVAISGRPAYFYGSLNEEQQDMLAQVTSVACASNVATIGITIQQGNVPAVGNLIWVQGTANASGAYNVSGVAIASVTAVSASAGTYLLTYACTTADLSTAAAAGKAIVPVQEVAEAVAANTSVAFYVPSQEPVDNGQRTITVACTFPTIQATTGAATIKAYTAITNNGSLPGDTGSEWTPLGTDGAVGTLASGSATKSGLTTFTAPAGRWFCLQTTSVTGTNKVIAKMLC
jgi:hypothetical protein